MNFLFECICTSRIRSSLTLTLLVALLLSMPVLFLEQTDPNPLLAAQTTPTSPFTVLVFSKTAAFRHGSIDAGKAAIAELAVEAPFTVRFTEAGTDFTDAGLADVDVVVFLNTTGDVLDEAQQAAFERFIQRGKGYVGIHSATDTEYGWPWYGGLIGSYFDRHPAVQLADVLVIDDTHPSTDGLPNPWTRTDEWYDFRAQPSGVNILLEVDEESYNGGRMGENHPIAWYHDYDGGRSWYTAMGHTSETFDEPYFRQHLLGGIIWAAGYTEIPLETPTPTPMPTALLTPSPTATPTPFAVTAFALIDADTNERVRTLTDTVTLDLADLPSSNLNVRAETSPAQVGSVRFALNEYATYAIEHLPPYALAGDVRGNYLPWVPAPGSYTIVAEPYSASFLTGAAGLPLSVTLTVIDSGNTALSAGLPLPNTTTAVAQTTAVTQTDASVNGVLYLDADRNGRADTTDQPVVDATLVFSATGANATVPFTVSTDAKGSFYVTDLVPEYYIVQPQLPISITALHQGAGALRVGANSRVELPDFHIFLRKDVRQVLLPLMER